MYLCFQLFDVPNFASESSGSPYLAGGLGTGGFRFTSSGEFTGWRLDPSQREYTGVSPFNRFYVWSQEKVTTLATSLSQRGLFPFTWMEWDVNGLPIRLESLSFSPLLPAQSVERSLPLHLVVFRANNPTNRPIETALMLTWACGWPELIQDAVYDFQHDNLCLTGSLGSPKSLNRQGVAIPDLHYMGIYQQGIEPWSVPGDEPDVVEDFAEDGELDPRVARAEPHGLAAWVKFNLEPHETKEVPYVLPWHFPQYERGDYRHYTQFLGRHRPDNAIVWLAEQAVQHYGAETANYRYWIQQISDWQRELGENAANNRQRS